MTTSDFANALEALRGRLSHAEAICDLLTRQDDSELAEAVRGVRVMLEDGIEQLDRLTLASAGGPA